jgi:hypothetical protein
MGERLGGRRAHKKFRVTGFAVFVFLSFATPAIAQTTHVRGEYGMQRLVDQAAGRSPAIQESIDRLQERDVTVYVRARKFVQLDLEGRIALLSTVAGHRYLVIELACGRSELEQMATLGHELYHALEIADMPWVVDADTLADLYSRIGMKTGDRGGLRTFETEAAAAAGLLARQQLLISGTRHGHGT